MNAYVLLVLAGLVLAGVTTVIGLHRRQLTLAAVATVGAVAAGRELVTIAPLLAGFLVVVVAGLVWLRWSRTSATVSRWGARSRRKAGVASFTDITRVASRAAMRRKATVVRPSLADISWRRRVRRATTEVAVPLCRVGLLTVWASIEDVVCVFGGPRTGKTGFLAGRVLDAPGAVLVTSTRTDLHDLTAPLRRGSGPVYVFNAVGLGDVPSTITFDPLTGCADPVTATERATDLISANRRGGEDSDAARWDAQARRVLAALLHAAALGGLGMREVLGWVSDPDTAHREITGLLRSSPEPAWESDAAQFLTTNDRTRSSITSSIMPALGWLTSPAACAAATGGQPFDVAELLRTRATVYLLGAEETHAAPLVTALTGHIAREARRLAAREPSGRLDPPVTLVLDEAALISPVPLESWTADMGGRGVHIEAAFQSRAQLIARWGQTGAAIILNNSASIMVFGGTKDRDDLDYWSALAGTRDEPVTTTNDHGKAVSRTVRQVPVLAAAQLANLPRGRVVVFSRGMAPVIGHVRMAWKRHDVRTAQRAERRDARAVVATAEAATRAPRRTTQGLRRLAPRRLAARWRTRQPTRTHHSGTRRPAGDPATTQDTPQRETEWADIREDRP